MRTKETTMKLVLKDYGVSNWYPYDPEDKDNNVELKVRPYPASREKLGLQEEGTLILSGSTRLDKFIYCLLDWKNVTDEDDKPIKCNIKNKETIFNYNIDNFVARVDDILLKISEATKESEKN